MSFTVPTDRIVQVLEKADYKSLRMPLSVAGISFNFSAAVVGTDRSSDLVVVSDTTETSDAKILSQIEGLARALDAVSSVRPLTLVLTGTRPTTKTLDAMASVCRVLVTDGGASEDEIKQRIAVLLPLELPPLKSPITDIVGLMDLTDDEDPLALRFLEEAANGTEEVKQLLFDLVSAPFSDDPDDEEDV
ncbi:hypothetical protein [Devosia sp. MC521]|uniref:hypothetical protein n=1 Tax=Devosia sp. MC521 TaxID=2759954 RepID=UPI0015FB2343|nr:hypothetical protein [Devosia sp. MC521]MBJ6986275.1 hypothetical protein [Devosia sp. MC521]QMW64242.1 hypothetical protein H4N61_08075 [Devosia sp. MC521]